MTNRIENAEEKLQRQFRMLEGTAATNQKRILAAFQKQRITEEHFAEHTGYGIHDAAREAIDEVFAAAFQAEAAAVRMQLVSGTHALACALFGNLKPGDRLASLTGQPYDTLSKVVGHKVEAEGSLIASGVSYCEFDWLDKSQTQAHRQDSLRAAVSAPTRVAYIQKSCGYSFARPSLTNEQVKEIVALVKGINPNCLVLVDNCYGEFVEANEPPSVGADLIAGSLIKNPGGGLAISGGYLAGTHSCVQSALTRLTAPGIDGQLGVLFNQNRLILQGLFMAPQSVFNALKAALLVSQVFEDLGFEVKPRPSEPRGDIIQSIKLGKAESLINFLQTIQRYSPVNSHVIPEAAIMPGYQDKVIMAGGTFVAGSTIEFSADGPIRPPYVAFVQGGMSYFHVRVALQGALEALGLA